MDQLTVAITIDLHDVDEAADIELASEWLQSRSIAATFFVPSLMLQQPRYTHSLQQLQRHGHEVASHTHHHNPAEMHALSHGQTGDLAFLSDSKKLHEDFFGATPLSFRSPCWCKLGEAAVDELERLEYQVDSSATPQRLGLFSSTPFADTWFFAPRSPYFLRDRLLEIPTSSFLIPAGSTAFLTLRSASRFFIKLLALEAAKLRSRILTLQFHVGDFNPLWKGLEKPRLQLSDFALRSHGGFGFKRFLRETDPRVISNVTFSLFDELQGNRFLVISDIAAQIRNTRAGDVLKRKLHKMRPDSG